jgi:hypothetical protein
MSWIDGLGFCASFAVLASFCMTTIVPLRVLALTSNVLFSAYGLLAHIYPVMLLHILLLPINLLKLWRLRFPGISPPRAEV